MGLILDTCIIIDAEKKKNSIDFSKWQSYEEVYISAVTVTELLIGVHRADTESRRLKRSAFVESVLAEIPILDFTAEIARIHAEIYALLAGKGQLIGAHDLIIGATALTHGYALLTTNQREFKRIPGLILLK
jgi:tRNA(fMet)-specific endonuclease VapC